MGGHGSAEHYILLDDRSVGLEGEALRAPVRMAGLPGTDQGDGRRSSWTGGPSREIGRDKKECDAAQAILLFSASGRPSPQYSFRLPSIREATPLLLGGGQASSLGRTPAVPTLAYPFCHEAAGRATAWRRLGSPSAARSRAGVVQKISPRAILTKRARRPRHQPMSPKRNRRGLATARPGLSIDPRLALRYHFVFLAPVT
jgi:hypothetical protein